MKPHSDPKVDYAFKHVFGREQSKPALGDLIMISQSERDCELYASRVKMRRDMNTALAEREELGEARGLEKRGAWRRGALRSRPGGFSRYNGCCARRLLRRNS
jgi:hypothetical protein